MKFVVRCVAAVAALSMVAPAVAQVAKPSASAIKRPKITRPTQVQLPNTPACAQMQADLAAATRNGSAQQCQLDIRAQNPTPANPSAASGVANVTQAPLNWVPIASVVGGTVVAGAVAVAATQDKSN